MITVYWPYKKVPDWLEKVEFVDPKRKTIAHHKGFGLIWSVNRKHIVWLIAGTFMYINGGGGIVKIKGGGRGVSAFFRLRDVIVEIRRTKSEAVIADMKSDQEVT